MILSKCDPWQTHVSAALMYPNLSEQFNQMCKFRSHVCENIIIAIVAKRGGKEEINEPIDFMETDSDSKLLVEIVRQCINKKGNM